MASTFNIQGPTSLSVMVGSDAEPTDDPTFGSAHILGYSSNEDMISVSIDNILVPHTTTESGANPAALIYHGSVATISATLIKYDTAVADTMYGHMWADRAGLPGVVGQDQFNSAFSHVEHMQVHIAPVASGTGGGFPGSTDRYSYTFRQCWLDSYAETEWGNAPKKLVLTFKCITTTSGRMFERN